MDSWIAGFVGGGWLFLERFIGLGFWEEEDGDWEDEGEGGEGW